MVLDTENPSFKLASCCNVDVVNGAEGFFVAGFLSTEVTLKFLPIELSKNDSVSANVSN